MEGLSELPALLFCDGALGAGGRPLQVVRRPDRPRQARGQRRRVRAHHPVQLLCGGGGLVSGAAAPELRRAAALLTVRRRDIGADDAGLPLPRCRSVLPCFLLRSDRLEENLAVLPHLGREVVEAGARRPLGAREHALHPS
eukprot:SAG22_NODE_546_length_9261_cov_18.423925_5_plen_141_part_00